MRTAFFLRRINRTSAGLVLLVVVVALAAGVSPLLFQSPSSPLYVGGAVLAVVLAVVSLRDPAWAFCAAVFVALLPTQILSFIPITVIRHYTVLLALLYACFSWLLGVVTHRRRIVWISTNLWMLAFLVWGIITLFWAPDLVLGRQLLAAYIVGFLLLILLVNNIDSSPAMNRLMATLALNGWVLVLAGVGTIITKGYIPGTRLEVLEMNENEMGILALVMMIGVLWQVVQPSPRHRQIMMLLSWTFMLMTIALVAASGSRGSAISLLVTLGAFCFWKPTRAWGLVGLAALTLGLILLPMLFTTTLERFAIIEGDTLLGGREVLWRASWNLILDHMWLGVGIGNARYQLLPYLLIGMLEKAPTHNPILQVWAETGLMGILLYVSIPASALWLFIREHLHYRRLGMKALLPYFALVSSTFLGYMASWIKGGGMEASFSYFLMLSLLLIPACLHSRGQAVLTEPQAMNTKRQLISPRMNP